MPQCPVCRVKFGDWGGVAEHLSYMARTSDGAHVMWLNRNISNSELRPEELEVRLRELFNHGGDLGMWIRRRVIDRFYGENPHPFILAMQRPNRAILLGYVIEHQHFLRN
ncbi:C2H2 type zinc finger domain-containing protein [Caldivirga sp.]|uniref:C2H2 type zinc finger domain-containing protein n=1 Tax=Caldivirga sp. TaxID=2080243 RepID=UPI0025C1D8E7|nr:C2H2 type zinc finger domain-containing protein [Caldivirga sp.]